MSFLGFLVITVLCVASFVCGMLYQRNDTKEANAKLKFLEDAYNKLKDKVSSGG